MTFDTVKKLLLSLVGLYLVMAFWTDPSGSAAALTGFVHHVGGFFSSVIDKSASFVKGLAS